MPDALRRGHVWSAGGRGFGILPPYRAGVVADPDWMVEFAQHAEAVGFSSIHAAEHPAVRAGYATVYPYSDSGRMSLPEDCVIPDPLELLSFLAGVTTSIRLGTGLLVLPVHHPIQLAKRLATLDRLSKGRLIVGVGLGWMREEIEAFGIDFDTRDARAGEVIEAMRSLWGAKGMPASHAGQLFAFDDMISQPVPHQIAGPPIYFGGSTRAAARRSVRYGGGFQPLGLDDEQLADRLEVIRQTGIELGRGTALHALVLPGSLDTFGARELERGERFRVTTFVLATTDGDLPRLKDQMSAFADEHIPNRPPD